MPIFMCQRGGSVSGLQVLLTGWLGVFALDPRWIANLGFFWILVSVIFRRKSPSPFMVLATVASDLEATRRMETVRDERPPGERG